MKILLSVDLSEPPAMTQMIEEMADRMQAELLVLHVCPPAPATTIAPIDPMTGLSAFAPYTHYDPQLEENIERADQNAFQSFLSERFRRPLHAALHKGDPAQLILEDADRHDVDLIVLGKHHHSRLEEWLVGSVTTEVVKHAKRPLLLYPLEKS